MHLLLPVDEFTGLGSMGWLAGYMAAWFWLGRTASVPDMCDTIVPVAMNSRTFSELLLRILGLIWLY